MEELSVMPEQEKVSNLVPVASWWNRARVLLVLTFEAGTVDKDVLILRL